MSDPGKRELSCPHPFVPADWELPASLQTDRFLLRMLSIHDVAQDFEAVMSSVEHLQSVWRTRWPDGLTLDQNLVDLGWHQKEFQRRSSFTYTVVSPDCDRVLGCVYIYPTRKTGFDAEVYFWARQDENAGLESELEAALKDWLGNQWPFVNPAFPGKDIAWGEWDAIEEVPR
jgi:RimJ/RimL family protein N-acetyltransferase